MAYETNTQNASSRTGLGGLIDRAFRALARASAAGEQFQQVERLRALSDTQLARLGLNRRAIPRRVYIERRLAF